MEDRSKHIRLNPMLLGKLERPALKWLAGKMPTWVTPDILTSIGFIGSVIVFIGYVLTNRHPGFLWLASLGFIINWFGDSLDGTLARFRNIERPKYGFFVDHTVDALDEVLVFLGLGLTPFVDFTLAALTLLGYMMMSILAYITTIVSGVFRIAYISLGPTEMRLFAIFCNTIIFFAGDVQVKLPWIGEVGLYNIFVGFIAALLFGGYVVIMLLKAAELAKIDEKKVNETAKDAKTGEVSHMGALPTKQTERGETN